MTGDVPYDAITLAMVEDDVPGGHAPGYFAMLNNPPPVTPFNWRNDPASFQGFPEFFLAHELAHQWFGQAVGWKNYHEQWLSEGFAQYFAALYAKERRGEGAFRDVLRQFRRWAIDDSDQGPVYLGYRLGHIKGESRVFRALVYNKGAAVLHMLRRLIGDEAFFGGLQALLRREPLQEGGHRRSAQGDGGAPAAATSTASSSAGSTTTASRACATARPWKARSWSSASSRSARSTTSPSPWP